MDFALPTLLRLYGAAWHLATPLLRRHKRLSTGFDQRLVPEGWPFTEESGSTPPRPDGPVIWIQAASGGEAKLVHSLVRALAQILDEAPAEGTTASRPAEQPPAGTAPPSPAAPPPFRLTLLCTTCTAQGLEVLQALPAAPSPSLRVLPRFFPLDHPERMERALQQASPVGVVLLETELWPGLLAATAKAGVPVFVYNARMTEKSAAGYAWLRSFWKKCAPRRVLATARDDAERFAALFGEARVALMHNIKFDGAAAALQRAPSGHEETALRLAMGLPPSAPDAPLVAFASVREEEEAMLLPVLRRLRQEAPGAHLVVAPRHLTRLTRWQAYAEEMGLPVLLRSTLLGNAPRNEDAVGPRNGPGLLLWDTFGDLHALYTMADVVFVGGSLAPLGGQNFLEALEAGVIPCIGPHWDNFLWVGDTLMEAGLVRVCAGPEDVATSLERACTDLGARPSMGWQEEREHQRALVRQQFSQWLTAHTGGSHQAAEALLADTGLRPPPVG